MKAKSSDLPAFSIVGIEARTNNAKEMGKDGVIPKQWERFFRDGILEKISDKVDQTIYAVYTDYQTDRTGDYSFVLGAKVRDGAAPSVGFVLKKIPAQHYAIFTSNRGPVSEVVPAVWTTVWERETSNHLHRSYRADFEVYDQRASDPKNTQVDVFVGTK